MDLESKIWFAVVCLIITLISMWVLLMLLDANKADRVELEDIREELYEVNREVDDLREQVEQCTRK